MTELHLGAALDPSTGDRSGARVTVDADDLTTHGVIVGMTGSGKTGLGVIALEEALLAGIPALVLDPKGDMANLCLTFPDFAPADFRPWIDEAQAQREGRTAEEEAASVAARWQDGTAGSGITPDTIRRLRDTVEVTVYTPGATSGVGLDLLGSLSAPAATGDGTLDSQVVDDEVTDVVSGLLALVGLESDPLTGREHILLANLLTDAWRKGRRMDLPTLITHVQQPPLRRLGVMDTETFFPAKDRMSLALRLNGLLASPTFAAWTRGVPVDIQQMLHSDSGAPRCAIVSLAHLDDAERQFVVTLVLSRLITWMRTQSGTSSLRAMIYMDEVFGFVPPVSSPPAKQPILTILKQARAFGVGMVLSTQNPVDLDYKAISNAGTWMIGRLQTERDKERLLEGMRSAAGTVDIDAVSAAISGLDKRQFLLHSTHADGPTTFSTRWAMSYLAGPLTAPQIAELMAAQKAALTEATGELLVPAETMGGAVVPLPPDSTDAPAAQPAELELPAPPPRPGSPGLPDTSVALADDETPTPPQVPDAVQQRYVDPAAPWAAELGAVPGGRRLVPHVAVRVRIRFDETRADLDHSEEFEAVLPVAEDPADLSGLRTVDYDDRDLRTEVPADAVHVLPAAKITTKSWWQSVERAVRDELDRNRTMTVLSNPELKIFSRPTETAEAFRSRCEVVAEEREDEEVEKLRKGYESKADRLRRAVERAQDRVAQLETDVSTRRSGEMVNIGSSILGGLLGGRRSGRGVAAGLRRAANQRGQTARTAQRLENAEGTLVDARVELQELEEELAADLLDIDHRWMEAAKVIEPVDVGLERDDIDVTALTLAWVPTGR